jgi:pilus assembly protein CpaB
VIVAAVELPAGSTLSADNLAVRSIPERYLASSVIEPEALDAIAGQRLINAVKPGDPIDRGGLERSDRAALSTTIQTGERAITFPVDEISSISGMLIPGDMIDLMFTGSSPVQNGTQGSQASARIYQWSTERTVKCTSDFAVSARSCHRENYQKADHQN